MADCWQCEGDLGPLRKVGREELCAGCAAWVHACKNCRNWNDRARTCEETAAEWVHDRERANFCDFFALPAPDESHRSEGGSSGKSARAAFDRLFKK